MTETHFENRTWKKYLPYYREKYLAAVGFITGLFALMALWPWPIASDRLFRGLLCLAVTSVCVLLSKRRVFILGGALAIISLRGMIAFSLSRNWVALVMGLVARTLLWGVIKFWGHRFENWEIPERYSLKELMADIFVFLLTIGGIYIVFRR